MALGGISWMYTISQRFISDSRGNIITRAADSEWPKNVNFLLILLSLTQVDVVKTKTTWISIHSTHSRVQPWPLSVLSGNLEPANSLLGCLWGDFVCSFNQMNSDLVFDLYLRRFWMIFQFRECRHQRKTYIMPQLFPDTSRQQDDKEIRYLLQSNLCLVRISISAPHYRQTS